MKSVFASDFEVSTASPWRSWFYVNDGFKDDFLSLVESNALQKDGEFPVIWNTKQKYVLKVQCASGRVFAYKAYNRLKKQYKFFFRLSPCGAEAANYQQINSLGIKTPQLLAVGDTRIRGVLKTAFIATEFVGDYQDGRAFFADGALYGRVDLCDEFICRNMQLLARLHDHNILHRGFTPMNLLFREKINPASGDDLLDIMWIDLASCRKLPRFMLKRRLIVDFEQFFRFFDFSSEKLRKYLACYLAAAENPLAASEDVLLAKLEKSLLKRRKKHC